jgi:heptosyltransferase III
MIPRRIIISRTDSIGDVMLTLPMCGVIKKHFPECEIIFLGRTYTEAVVKCCDHVDFFENWDMWNNKSPQAQIEELRKWKADAIIHVFPNKDL